MQVNIAKINDIEILQVGKSTLSFTNKKEDKNDAVTGKNEQIDLGKAQQTLSITIKIINESDFEKIYKMATDERKCTLIDKFLGEMKVSVDSFKVEHSDSDFGVTTCNFTFKITESFKIKPDYSGQLVRAKDTVLGSIKARKFLGVQISTDFRPRTVLSPIEAFKDKLDTFSKSINSVVSTATKVVDITNDLGRLRNNITNTIKNPILLVSAISPFFDSICAVGIKSLLLWYFY